MAGGRPTKYSKEIADKICNELSKGGIKSSLRKVCADKSLPTKQTVGNWLLNPKYKEFFAQYARAKFMRADNMFEDILEIVQDEAIDVNRAKLIADNIKWCLSKMRPDMYGDRIQQDHSIAGVMPADKASEITKMMQDAIEKMGE
jgi:hypothetical protein